MNGVVLGPLKPSSKWSSLFNILPRNVDECIPCSIEIIKKNSTMIPSAKVLEARVDFWSEFLISFFLDSNPP